MSTDDRHFLICTNENCHFTSVNKSATNLRYMSDRKSCMATPMSLETPPPQNIVTLAVVIESSLEIAQEWPNPLFYYCTQLFKRVSDAHHPARVLEYIPLFLICI